MGEWGWGGGRGLRFRDLRSRPLLFASAGLIYCSQIVDNRNKNLFGSIMLAVPMVLGGPLMLFISQC